MRTKETSSKVQPGMLYIPDISGFTKFVRSTDITHSQHIIQELLETIIEANEMGLEVSEIEGDAILFYKMGKAPTAAELLSQIQKMYVRFHHQLKKYDKMRICQCGACTSAHSLKLKFIVHYGPIAFNQVKDHLKLFGEDVVVAHRLLKNDIEQDEYALFSNSLVKACETWVDIPVVSWSEILHGEAEYDSGPVHFCHISLEPLQDHVPEPSIEDMGLKGPKVKIAEFESSIQAPIELVFSVFMDLKSRATWLEFTQRIENVSDKITRNGSSHQCIMDAKNKPVIATHDLNQKGNVITFWETDDKKDTTNHFTLRKLAPALTRMEGVFFMKRSLLMVIMFNLLMKKKFRRMIQQTGENVKSLCEEMYANGKSIEGGVYLDPTG